MTHRFKAVLALAALIILGTSGFAHPYYIGYSGAPGSSGRCASSCHGSSGGTIEVNGFPTEYFPGQTYTITISHNGGSAIKQFNGSCRIGSSSANAGTIAAGTNTVTYNTSGETNGVHLSAIDLDNGTFEWTSPPSGTGDVTLYVAGHQGVRTGPNTTLTLVSSEFATDVPDNGSQSVPSDYKLSDNYPNPFNPTTTIEFYLPRPSHVSVEIFNLLGRKVAVLADAEYTAGNHTLTWSGLSSDGHAVSSGTYFYRMEAGAFIQTKKMLFVK